MLISRYVTILQLNSSTVLLLRTYFSHKLNFVNVLFFGRLHILEQWLASSWLANNVVNCSNIVSAKENLERLVSIWCPFQGKTTALIPKLLQKSHFDSKNRRVVFVGTGSAVNFLLDVVSFLSKAIEHIETDIVILFSTRDEVLHDWVFRAMSNILKLGIERSMQTGNSGIKVLLALTGRTHSCDLKNTMHTVSMEREPSFDVTTSSISMCVCDGNPTPSKPGMIEVLYNHIDYGREIQDHSVVFCQVSTVIKEFVRKVCLSKDEVEFYMN